MRCLLPAWLVYTPGLWCYLRRSFISFSNWRGWLGARSFFSPSHFPAMFWTAFLQTSYSPWGIVSAWWDWMIVLIHKGLESDSKQGTQRKLRSQVQQRAQLKCGELCSLHDLLAPPGEECFPVVALKWNFTDSSVVLLYLAVIFVSFLSTWALLECQKSLNLLLRNCKKDAIKWLFHCVGCPCDQMKNRFKIQFLPWQCKTENKLSLKNSPVLV